MSDSSLGRLKAVDLRSVWQSEAGGFTPWLAQDENIALLGDAIGIDLEVEAQEKEVGPFRADILCKDTTRDTWVLIENQLERTDHIHLGQLLTYAAGLNTVSIVWIAKAFTEEHRAALDWLNEMTDERIRFFGLEVELWQIANSPIAPKFNVVCKPNDWSKSISGGAARVAGGELTEAKQTQLEYWQVFRQLLQEKRSFLKTQNASPQHWLSIALGRSGFRMSAIASFYDSEADSFSGHEIRAEVIIDDHRAKEYFALLQKDADQIQREVGEAKLVWHNPPDKRLCKVYVRRSADLNDRQTWPAQHAWLQTQLEALHRAFAPRVKRLQLPAATATSGD